MKPHHLLTDAELAVLLKAGDHAAFAEIYDRFFSVLYVHAFNRLRDEDEAKDVVHELFTTMWAKHESAVFTNLSNYLYTSVRNRIINAVAHKAVATKYIEALPQSVIIEDCITDYKVRERQLAAIIAREIATLPPKMREVFHMQIPESELKVISTGVWEFNYACNKDLRSSNIPGDDIRTFALRYSSCPLCGSVSKLHSLLLVKPSMFMSDLTNVAKYKRANKLADKNDEWMILPNDLIEHGLRGTRIPRADFWQARHYLLQNEIGCERIIEYEY